MSELDKAKRELLPAARQYRHNNNDGLILGYEAKKTQEIVQVLIDMNSMTESISKSNYGALECCSLENAKLKKELAQVKELNKSMFEVINFYRHENGQEEMLDTEQYKKEYFEEKK